MLDGLLGTNGGGHRPIPAGALGRRLRYLAACVLLGFAGGLVAWS